MSEKVITLLQLKQLKWIIDHDWTDDGAGDIPDQLKLGALALRISLVTGRTLEQIAKFSHVGLLSVNALTSLHERLKPGLLCLEGEYGWWLPAGEIQRDKCDISVHVAPRSSGVWLPADARTVQLILELFPPLQLKKKFEYGLFYKLKGRGATIVGLLEQCVEMLLKEAARQLGLRSPADLPGPADCAEYLRNKLRLMPRGDEAISWLISDSVPEYAAATVFYTSLSLTRAIDLYLAAVADIAVVDWSGCLPETLADRSVGDEHAPSPAAMRNLKSMVAYALPTKGRPKTGYEGRKDRADRHLRFSVYSWLVYAVLTGRRNRKELFPPQRCFDIDAGTLLLEDKMTSHSVAGHEAEPPGEDSVGAGEDDRGVFQRKKGHKVRWIPLPIVARRQLSAYRQHLCGMTRDAEFSSEDREDLENQLEDKARPLPLVAYALSQSATRLRFWDQSDMQGFLAELGWKVPINFPRHYLRSELVGQISSEVINAYLGHWPMGAEPWWHGSSADPQLFAPTLEAALGGEAFECWQFMPAPWKPASEAESL